MGIIKSTTWLYTSRVKEEDSFALKIESGRFKQPNKLEDFFGCTIVVNAAFDIDDAVELLSKDFIIEEFRPPDITETRKRPESFDFDYLRLYAKLRQKPSKNPSIQ